MAGFDIDPERLHQHGRNIEQLGTGSSDQLRGLRHDLTGNSSPWGADQAGSTFGSAYQDLLSATDEISQLFTDGLQDVGRTLQDAANSLKTTDQDAHQRLERLMNSPEEQL